jgi:magnesium-transporting ATPase (P-type)
VPGDIIELRLGDIVRGDQFRTGWFVESLATQTLVIFAIRTRRVPFFHSHPSIPLMLAALDVVAVGALLPATPIARALGFQPLPGDFFIALAGGAGLPAAHRTRQAGVRRRNPRH